MPGGGGKTSSSTTSSPFAGILANIGQSIWKTAKPVFKTYASQAEEALKTGGVNSNIPSINASVDASRQAGSQANTKLRQQLASSGLAGSSFANAILAEEGGATAQRTAEIPAEATQAFIGQAVPATLGMVGTGVGALGTAAQTDYTSTSTRSFWDYFMQGLQAASSGAAAAARA